MIEIIQNFPQMFSENPAEVKINLKKRYNKVLVCGMGGSGIIGDIVKDAFDFPVTVVNDYKLPKIDDKTIVIAISCSGNTEETVSCIKGLDEYIAIASGGKTLENAKNYIKIKATPKYHARFWFPYLLKAMCIALEKTGFIKRVPVIKFDNTDEINKKAHALACKLKKKALIIYTSCYESIAKRAKHDFNENAKIPCYYEIFPELAHNEIVGWGTPLKNNFNILTIRHDYETERLAKQINAIKDLLKDRIEIFEYKMQGASKLEAFFNTIWFLGLTSIYLGDMNGIDPAENIIIDKLKEKMKGLNNIILPM